MAAGFLTPLDIINRALQHAGVDRIYSLADLSMQAQEVGFAYDRVRRAELRRNVWRFAVRRAWLWPLDTTSLLLKPGAWASGTTYNLGDMVSGGSLYWTSRIASNTGNTPTSTTVGTGQGPDGLAWDSYFGSLNVEMWNVLGGNVQDTNLGYALGDLVYTTPGDGTYKVYFSLADNNTNDPAAVDAWSASTMYGLGAVVSYNSVNYQSLVALNFNNEPDTSPSQWSTSVTNPTVSGSWRAISTVTGSPDIIAYPLGSGPASDNTTRNLFRLPSGYLRKAPQFPAGNRVPWLGMPAGNSYNDWEISDGFIVSQTFTPIVFRFVADVQDVSLFDDMFCEGLAASLALNVGPRLTDKAIDRAAIMEAYGRAMFEARVVNGIEEGAIDPPEDEWITVRA